MIIISTITDVRPSLSFVASTLLRLYVSEVQLVKWSVTSVACVRTTINTKVFGNSMWQKRKKPLKILTKKKLNNLSLIALSFTSCPRRNLQFANQQTNCTLSPTRSLSSLVVISWYAERSPISHHLFIDANEILNWTFSVFKISSSLRREHNARASFESITHTRKRANECLNIETYHFKRMIMTLMPLVMRWDLWWK